MNKTSALKILKLNEDFYAATSEKFNETRQYQWRGWTKLFTYFRDINFIPSSILDLGCGNGRFVEVLKENIDAPFNYLGIDNNKFLLGQAQSRVTNSNICKIQFKNTNIFSDYLDTKNTYDLIVMFGVFHHLPSDEFRIQLLENIKSHLTKYSGRLVLTTWNFKQLKLFQKRLRNKEFTLLGFDDSDIQKNDYFLSWSNNLKAIRYCHYYTRDEIISLIKFVGGLKIEHSFRADGQNSKTNTYYVISQT